MEPEFFSDLPEKELAATLNHTQRTLLGQVFTPFVIAREMARWVTALRPPAQVLDPALGLGVFLRALLEKPNEPLPHMVGYEIDPDLADQAWQLFLHNGFSGLEIHASSYLSSNWEPRYDAILCNPPYRKFRGLPGKNELVTQVQSNTGIKLSQAANLYAFFLIKAVHQLAENGRAVFILPYEFFNADYGRVIKQYLLDEGVLRKILILGKRIYPFERVITTTCILCLERTAPVFPPEVINCQTLEELSAAITAPVGISPAEEVPAQPANSKWLVSSQARRWMAHPSLVLLSTFGRVSRGIATGDNGYFLLTETQRQRWGLNKSCVLPCLSKSVLAPDPVFSTASFDKLRLSDKPVWLFRAAGNETDPAVERYLAYGIESGADRRYLTRNRTPWYALEERPPAPLLATTFSRSGIRWVRNEAAVRFLTAFHGFYPTPDTDLELLAAYLITPLAQRILAQNRREYGNGLHKFEPNDLNHGLVLDIRLIHAKDMGKIKKLYREFITLDNQAPEKEYSLNRLDRIFSVYLE